MKQIERRSFLRAATVLPAAASLTTRVPAADSGSLKKSVVYSMLPRNLSHLDRFKLARDIGLDGVEAHTAEDPKLADEIAAASSTVGLKIHSVMNSAHWKYPLSSSNPEDVKMSVAGMETSLRNAKLFGAETVLLVPAVVNAGVRYEEAYRRSQEVIRERILPLAAQLKVVVAVEDVWNKFLLSPMEFAAYVDSFKSPFLQAYFDVGNIVLYAYPQDWIRTLGKRINRVHIKDFMLDRRNSSYSWKNLGEGEIDWPEVRKALGDIGYIGWMTAEISGGDEKYLRDVVARMNRIIAGEPPVPKQG